MHIVIKKDCTVHKCFKNNYTIWKKPKPKETRKRGTQSKWRTPLYKY